MHFLPKPVVKPHVMDPTAAQKRRPTDDLGPGEMYRIRSAVPLEARPAEMPGKARGQNGLSAIATDFSWHPRCGSWHPPIQMPECHRSD